jgi:histone H3/H4
MQSTTKRKKRKGSSEREIAKQQKKVDLIIPAAPFRRLVNELTDSEDIRYQQEAVKALQTASESYILDLLNDANTLASYAGRETLHGKDITLALRLKK